VYSTPLNNKEPVIFIISNEAYVGTWHYGVKINATATKRPREEWITVSIPPIIDRDMWEAAQVQKKVNHQMAKRNGKVDYLLSGRLKCVCGWTLTGTITGNDSYKHRRYVCGSQHALPRKDGKICKTPSIRAEAIENDVWNSIVGIFSDLTRFEQLLRIAQEDEQKALNPKQDELESILRIIESTEQEAVEIGQALRRVEGIVAKLIEPNMQEVNKRYEALCNRRDILRGELSEIRLTDDTIRNAIIFAQDINAGIQNADFETKRKNLDLLQVKVTIKGKHFFVKSLLGEWDGEIRKLPRKSNVAIANNTV
jgi:site-specific DNA recombinase